jgi:hypothetical protein
LVERWWLWRFLIVVWGGRWWLVERWWWGGSVWWRVILSSLFFIIVSSVVMSVRVVAGREFHGCFWWSWLMLGRDDEENCVWLKMIGDTVCAWQYQRYLCFCNLKVYLKKIKSFLNYFYF